MAHKSLSRSSTKTALPNPILRNSNVRPSPLSPFDIQIYVYARKNCDLIKLATRLISILGDSHQYSFHGTHPLPASFNHTRKRFCSRTKLRATMNDTVAFTNQSKKNLNTAPTFNYSFSFPFYFFFF